MTTLRVTSYTPLANHGGVFPNRSVILTDARSGTAGPTKYTTLSRAFACECGEPLRDGDPVDAKLYEQGRAVHANCVVRVGA